MALYRVRFLVLVVRVLILLILTSILLGLSNTTTRLELSAISYRAISYLGKEKNESLQDKVDGKSDEFKCPLEPCNLNIVFMGDSLTRYMYVSLAHFLRFNNTWIEPTDHPNMAVAQTYLDKYETKAQWTNYYVQTMTKLAPYENCDCFRSGDQSISENRYFYDPTRNNTITYIQAFGSRPIHGHWLDPVKAARVPMQVQQGNKQANLTQNVSHTDIPILGPMPAALPDLWSGGWDYAIETHISQIQPDILVMNAGYWSHSFHEPDVRKKLLEATRKVGIPRVIWKTTTSARDSKKRCVMNKADVAMCEIMECFDITHRTCLVNTSFYHDDKHFYEPVYRKMNEEFFSFLEVPILSTSTLPWSFVYYKG